MAPMAAVLLLALCLTSAAVSAKPALHRQLAGHFWKRSASKDVVKVVIPPSSQEGAKVLRSQGMPRVNDVVSVKTLPTITKDGKDVPPELLTVSFTGSPAELAAGAGKRVVSEQVPAAGRKLKKGSAPVKPFQGSDATMRNCNVAPPPFRTLISYEDSGSLSNGVVSLLFYRGSSVAKVCSGWQVHPLRVVTAAHCIYDIDAKKYYYEQGHTLVVSTGLNGKHNTDTYSSAGIKALWVSRKYPGYSRWSQSLYDGTDTAVLVLSSSLSGRSYGWASPSAGGARMVLGYPGVSQTGFDQIGDIASDPSAAPLLGCSGLSTNIICERLSTEGGHSGSALFASYNSDVVVATLSGGVTNDCPSFFTLAVPRVTSGTSVTSLIQSSGCTVDTSNTGVSRVGRC